MIQRVEYLKRLIGFKDKRVIKIITGIRRCGKSTLFELYQDYLRENGVAGDQIIAINFEDPDFEELLDRTKLYAYIKKRLLPGKMNYVFLDEIQNVPEYQKTADGLFIKKNVDLYLTGSNAHLLSGEIATLLSGRYIEINLLPLSFREYVNAKGGGELTPLYTRYITEGSFPYILELEGNRNNINEYLGGIYNTILLKDVMGRKNISDPMMLESIARFMFFNIGNLTSTTNIANTMRSAQRPVAVHTVERYLSGLLDSYILYQAGRYDIRGKQHLQTGDKYYAADMGLRRFLLGAKAANLGSILENIVYLELLRRGYRVYVGKIGSREIDFIAENTDGITEYYQVALTVRDQTVLTRELEPLKEIRDHNAKYLLTLDDDPLMTHEGIRQMYALDWLQGSPI
jgi:predicted AAA+ superfamily ATPase